MTVQIILPQRLSCLILVGDSAKQSGAQNADAHKPNCYTKRLYHLSSVRTWGMRAMKGHEWYNLFPSNQFNFRLLLSAENK
jgi:hypothetical protein